MMAFHLCLQGDYAAKSIESAKRTIELRVGSISDKLRQYLINDEKMSEVALKSWSRIN